MTIFINGLKKEVPGCKTVSWVDGNPKVKQANKTNARTTWMRGIVCHTHKGLGGKLLPGTGPDSTVDEALARYQVSTDRDVSWDWTIDKNGDVTWQNDVNSRYCWQAGGVNPFTCGFEMIQEENGDQWQSCIDASVTMIDYITAVMGIQRQIPWDKVKDEPYLGIITRLEKDHGRDVVGVYGHCNVTTNRGKGDPNKFIFEALKKAGYLTFDYNNKEDIQHWKNVQRTLLGVREAQVDGIPGLATRDALLQKGFAHGMLVPRPIDKLIK